MQEAEVTDPSTGRHTRREVGEDDNAERPPPLRIPSVLPDISPSRGEISRPHCLLSFPSLRMRRAGTSRIASHHDENAQGHKEPLAGRARAF